MAYVIEKNKKRIFITGDVSVADQNWVTMIRHVDLAIIDGSHFRKGGHLQIDKITGQVYGHTGIPDLVELLSKITNHIVVIHLGSWFMREPEKGEEQIRNLSTEKLNVEPAIDGQIILV